MAGGADLTYYALHTHERVGLRSHRSGKKIQSVGLSASRSNALGTHGGGGVARERNDLLRRRHVHGPWTLENESAHATGGNTRGIADELRA